MGATASPLTDTGLEVIDLRYDAAFPKRRLHTRDAAMQIEGMRRLTQAFVQSPDTVLQELVNVAVDLCGADSAGISLEREQRTDDNYYHWIATAGKYQPFLNATLPRYPSACSICLERARPQLFRVTQRFFDLMGVGAPIVTDGLLLPWQVGSTRGTIWIMSHTKPEAFDSGDLRMMEMLADFSAMAVRHQRQQDALLHQATDAAAAQMANELAHQINNPLQSLTNLVYLAAHNERPGDAKSLAQELSLPIERLSTLIKQILALPGRFDPAK